MVRPITEKCTPMSTLDRLSLVVECFRDTPRLTLADVAHRTGIPRSSVHRMLLKLVRMGWLRREGLRYEIGDKLGDFGVLSLYRNKFDRVVAPLLEQLHEVTGCAVHFGVLEGNHVRYLHKVDSRIGPYLQTAVGSRIPARSSTIGKALLTAVRQPVGSLRIDARHTTVFGTCTSGMGCIGARVGVLDTKEVGLSISGPLIRGKIDERNAGPVQMAAAAISQYLGVIEDHRGEKPDSFSVTH